jgi:hypothetical protein
MYSLRRCQPVRMRLDLGFRETAHLSPHAFQGLVESGIADRVRAVRDQLDEPRRFAAVLPPRSGSRPPRSGTARPPVRRARNADKRAVST